jgi:hypothetical protein
MDCSRPFADNSHPISALPNPLKSRCARYGAKFSISASRQLLQHYGLIWVNDISCDSCYAAFSIKPEKLMRLIRLGWLLMLAAYLIP